MRCEVCGRKIHSEPIRALIEGAKLTVCVECSKHGRIILHEEEDREKKANILNKPKVPVTLVQKRKPPVAKVEFTQELVEGYDSAIRVAREKLGLSHEELGLKINEKSSVLRHVETGKMAPNNMLTSKLERVLKIKLLVPINEEKIKQEPPKSSSRELTLGDLIDLTKEGGEPKERKQS